MTPNLIIHKTNETPKIEFLFDENRCLIEGESIPEDPADFYEPIIETFKNHILNSESTTELNFTFDLQYFNTASLKMLFSLVKTIADLNKLNKQQTKISWIINEADDEDLIESVSNIEEMADMKIEMIVK